MLFVGIKKEKEHNEDTALARAFFESTNLTLAKTLANLDRPNLDEAVGLSLIGGLRKRDFSPIKNLRWHELRERFESFIAHDRLLKVSEAGKDRKLKCITSDEIPSSIRKVENTELLSYIDHFFSDSSDSIISNAIVSVDLSMRDSDLEKAFHQWLADQRSERKKTRFPADSSALLKRLINARVLPYLDLKILSAHFRKKITYKDISQILFDNNSNYDAENVRKTVKELADKALDPLFLIHLLKN